MKQARDGSNGVYPRVCGGAKSADTLEPPEWGLSPRVRGSHGKDVWIPHSQRSIPACAGEPTPWAPPAAASPVYPRVCGGAMVVSRARLFLPGLSPRVRGSQCHRAPSDAHPGSIPACAGEPWLRPHRHAAIRVYPRVCGGAALFCLVRQTQRGLSPRVRGSPIWVKPAKA